jgi:cytochrome c-type biogenesis protein
VGLGIPFLVAAVGLNWYLAGARRVTRWLRPLELGAGALLVVVGVLLFTGRFTVLSSFLAGFGQLVPVGL